MKRCLDFEALEGRRLMTGATQFSGVGESPGECTGIGADPGWALSIDMEGSLSGCLYSYPSTFEQSPSGTYRETGVEMFVELDATDEVLGTFETTYLFTAKYELLENGEIDFDNEIQGRCQHPITAGSGTGKYEEVTGRIDFKDDIANGNFPFRGHLRSLY